MLSTAYHTALVYLVHSWCTEFHGIQGRLHPLHRREHCGVKSCDVAILGHVRFRMTQDTLNDLLVRTQFIQIRRDATPEQAAEKCDETKKKYLQGLKSVCEN